MTRKKTEAWAVRGFLSQGDGDVETRCACGKYRGDRFKGIICERCGFELLPPGLHPLFVMMLSWENFRELQTFIRSWADDERRTSANRLRAQRLIESFSKAKQQLARTSFEAASNDLLAAARELGIQV